MIDPPATESRLYSAISWRILPLLFMVYGLGYVDRVNVSFAQLSMRDSLHFDDQIYGFGAGILFVGYFLFEIPSNLILTRIGARLMLSMIMAFWGVTSACTAFIDSPTQFYIIRFLIGVFEAGLFPGIVFYLGHWYPANRKARILALLLISGLAASVTSGPVSGAILQYWRNFGGLENWQWLFILEGLPSLVFAGILFFMLCDRPGDARWLSESEVALVESAIHADDGQKANQAQPSPPLFGDPTIYLLAAGLFTVLSAYYAVTFWLPGIIASLGVTDMVSVGTLTIIPNVAAGLAMFLNSRHSDASGERRYHFTVPMIIGAGGLLLSISTDNLALTLFAFSMAFSGVMSAIPIFWAITTDYLPMRSAAVGIAFINSLGAVSGFVSPYAIGSIKKNTGSFFMAFLLVAFVMIAGAMVMLMAQRKRATINLARPPI
jgi:MFS family permease